MHLLLWELIVTVEHMLPNAELIHLGYKKHDVKMESLLACLSLSPIFCKSSNCRSIQVARVNITICKTRGKYMLGKPQGKAKKCTWFLPYFHKWNNTSWKLSHKWLAKRIFKATHDSQTWIIHVWEAQVNSHGASWFQLPVLVQSPGIMQETNFNCSVMQLQSTFPTHYSSYNWAQLKRTQFMHKIRQGLHTLSWRSSSLHKEQEFTS